MRYVSVLPRDVIYSETGIWGGFVMRGGPSANPGGINCWTDTLVAVLNSHPSDGLGLFKTSLYLLSIA